MNYVCVCVYTHTHTHTHTHIHSKCFRLEGLDTLMGGIDNWDKVFFSCFSQ